MVPSDDLKAENVLSVVEMLQPFSTGGGREPGLYIHLPQPPNPEIPLRNTPAYKGLVLLWFIKFPHQRPHLSA